MLIWFDGFDYLNGNGNASAALLDTLGWWNNSGMAPQTGGRFGGNCLGQIGNPVNWHGVTQVLKASYAAGYLGQALYAGIGAQFSFFDVAGNNDQVVISFQNYGVVQATLGDGTTQSSAPNSWFPAIWQYVEAYCSVGAGTAGSLIVKINGATVLNLPAIATQKTANASFGGFRWYEPGSTTMQIDDVYFCDPTGAAPYNSFLGNVRVQALLPAGAGSSTQWTPSGSEPNWQSATNTNVDDTLYVTDGTAGQEDLYAVAASIGAVAVLGVQARAAYRQDDATQRSAQTILMSGSSAAATTAVPCSQSYAMQTDGPWTTDPATGSGWLPAAVNAVQIGPKVAA
jgi:hypothetical protein